MTKQERKEKFQKARPYVQFGITIFIEAFTGAVSNAVLEHVEGNKLSRFGAWVGGGLVGLMVGDRVSEYVCDNVEQFIDNMEEIKQTIENEKVEGS